MKAHKKFKEVTVIAVLCLLLGIMPMAAQAQSEPAEEDQISRQCVWGYDRTAGYYHWSCEWVLNMPFLTNGHSTTQPSGPFYVFDLNGDLFQEGECGVLSCTGKVLFAQLGTANCPTIVYPVVAYSHEGDYITIGKDLKIFINASGQYVAEFQIPRANPDWHDPANYSSNLSCSPNALDLDG